MAVRKFVFLIISALILSVTACEPINIEIPIAGSTGSGPSLVNTSWKLISFGQPGSETQTIEGKELILHFEEGNLASGSGGCNMFGAKYEVTGGDKLSLTEVVSPLSECEDEDLLEQETQFFDALRSAESFELAGDVLKIHYGDGLGVLSFLRIPANNPGNVHI